MMLIKKNPSSFFFCFIHRVASVSHLLHFPLSSSCENQNPPQNSNSITEYLITSCGLSPQKAATASKYIAPFASFEKPDSVRHFFKHHGFTDADIRTIISGYPRILNADAGQTMEPNLQELRRVGFADHELRKFITCNPQALLLRSTIPRIEFWRTLLGGDMKKLFVTFTKNRSLVNLDIDKNAIPKIALLKEYGLSDSQVGMVVSRRSQVFGKSITSLEALLKRVHKLGFPRGSSMFVAGLVSLSCVSPDLFETKLGLFRSFGWAEEEFIAAMNKNPFIIALSEENIRQKIKFFVEKAGCTQSYIALHPTLLNFSFEKRLMPRLHVVEILRSSKSVRRNLKLHSIMNFPEKRFMEKIVLRYKEVVPGLHETYVGAFKNQV